MMRSGQWFPRRAAIGIAFGQPITPTGSDFAAALSLRDSAGVVILAGCGEEHIHELARLSPATGPAPPIG